MRSHQITLLGDIFSLFFYGFYAFFFVLLTLCIADQSNILDTHIQAEKSIPEVAIIIMYCGPKDENTVIPELFGIPYFTFYCDQRTNRYDCHEGIPYLKFIYENYDLPAAKKFIFIHGHNTSWHHPVSIYTVINNLLRTKQFYEMDYGSVNHFFYQTYVHWVKIEKFRKMFLHVYHDTPMMKFYNTSIVWFPCCATFFVDSKLFKTRSKEFYRELIHRYRDYSVEDPDPYTSYYCGQLLEYTWHIIFTDKPVMEDRNYTLIDTGEMWSKAPPLFHPELSR